MDKFKELSLEETLGISGGNRLDRLRNGIRLVFEALGIQDAVNEFADGWNSIDCE